MKHIKYLSIVVVIGTIITIGGCKSKKPVSVLDTGEIEISFPCFGSDFESTKTLIRATAVGESMDQQMANRMARSAALEELGTKIRTSINSVIEDYYISRNQNMTEDLRQRFQGQTDIVVRERISGYRVICERFTRDTQTRNYKCYMAIEIGTDAISQTAHQRLTDDQMLRIDYDYERFREKFNEAIERAR